jgi:hypothetical protein
VDDLRQYVAARAERLGFRRNGPQSGIRFSRVVNDMRRGFTSLRRGRAADEIKAVLGLVDQWSGSADRGTASDAEEYLRTAFRFAALSDGADEIGVQRIMSFVANHLARSCETDRISEAMEWSGRSLTANASVLALKPNDARATRNLRGNYINLGVLCESRGRIAGLTAFEQQRCWAEARLWYRRASAQDRVVPPDTGSGWTADALRAREAACDRLLASARSFQA